MPYATGTSTPTRAKMLDRLAAPAGAFGAVAFLLAPQSAPGLVVAAAMTALLFGWLRLGRWPVASIGHASLAFVPLAAWLLISAIRSPDVSNGVSALFTFGICVACSLGCIALSSQFSDDASRRMADGLVFGFAAATWLLLADMATNLGVRRLFASIVPVLPHDYVTWSDGWITIVPSFLGNKNMAALMFLAWPVLLLSRGAARFSRAWWARAATACAGIAAVALSDHEASKLAIVVSVGVFLAATWNREWTWRVLAAGWVAATLLVVPVAYGAYQIGAYRFDAIQYSGKHRLVIWGSTAEEVAKAPIFGKGLGATRASDEATSTRGFAPGTTIKLGTNIHSHNVFLQMWHEAGLIGAVLLMIAGWPVLAWLRRTPDAAAPYMMAAWGTAMVMAAITWSMVAAWFIASFAYAALWAAFAADGERRMHAGDRSANPSAKAVTAG